MADEKETGLDHVVQAMEDELLAASDEDILDEAKSAGVDPADLAASMRGWLNEAVPRANADRMRLARAALEADRERSAGDVVPLRRSQPNVPAGFHVPDTLAARSGKKASEKDEKALEDDFNELFDDDAWGDDPKANDD